MARWLERDPAGYVDGPSLYAYLGRSPVDGVDPLGLYSWDDLWGDVAVIISDTIDATNPALAYVLDSPKLVDAAAGYGDGLSGGVTYYVRHIVAGATDASSIVDEESREYLFGWGAGALTSVAVPGSAGVHSLRISIQLPRAGQLTVGGLVVIPGSIAISGVNAAAVRIAGAAAAFGATNYGVRWYNASTGESGFYSTGSGGGLPSTPVGKTRPINKREEKLLGGETGDDGKKLGIGGIKEGAGGSRANLYIDDAGNIWIVPNANRNIFNYGGKFDDLCKPL
jgi:hypothetical protein